MEGRWRNEELSSHHFLSSLSLISNCFFNGQCQLLEHATAVLVYLSSTHMTVWLDTQLVVFVLFLFLLVTESCASRLL